jgi:hypothetical protein
MLTEDVKNKIRFVAKWSDNYKEQMLFQTWPERDVLLNDSMSALEFFFGHIFYQGRNDELSERYRKIAERVVTEQCPDLTNLADNVPTLTEESSLDLALKAAGLNKRMDRLMVLDTLELLKTLPDANVVAYSIGEIQRRRCIELFLSASSNQISWR